MGKNRKILLGLIIFVLVFNFFALISATKIKAQTDPATTIAIEKNTITRTIERIKSIYDKYKETLLFRAGRIAYKNALRTFLSRLAYDTATRLAEGNIGQSPLFDVKNMGDFLSDVAETTLVDTLDFLASENGFFEFDVCSPPDLNLRFAIHYSLFQARAGRGAPRCTLNDITKSWSEWAGTIGQTLTDSEEFLTKFRDAFKPEQSEAGIYLTLDASIRSRIADEETKQMFDRLANQSFKAVTEPITGFIKTPAAISRKSAEELASDRYISEDVPTGDIVADSLGIFTNTLAAKLMKRLLDQGLTEGQRARSTLAYNWVSQQAGLKAADQFATLAEVSYTSGQERVLEYLTQCPNPQSPGPLDCVIPSSLVTAIEQKYTVKEALAKGNLNGELIFGFYANDQQPDFREGYPYRSLVIMRQHRIIPVGWELAALYGKEFDNKTLNLNYLIKCFEDPGNADDNHFPETCRNDEGINPYYHLVDPNWVLKAPESYCVRKGAGYQILGSEYVCLDDNVSGTRDLSIEDENSSYIVGPACELDLEKPDKPVLIVSRDTEYCADRKSCLWEDDAGNCQGGYGYCLQEKPIWRFSGQSCNDYYNSCETFTRSDNQEFTYLRDTLQACPRPNDAGCLWYSTSQEKTASGTEQLMAWQDENKIYLNSQAGACQADGAGCTKLSRMLPGINTAFNGNFELNIDGDLYLPDGWIGQNSNTCESTFVSEQGRNNSDALSISITDQGSACGATTESFIPVDPAFTYSLGAYLRSSTGNQRTDVCLLLYNQNQQRITDGDSERCNILDNNDTSSLFPDTDWQLFSGTIADLPDSTRYVKIDLQGPRRANNSGRAGTVWYDNIQLVITESPVVKHNPDNFGFNPENYKTDYSQDNDYGRQYLKVAPEYLGCEGFNYLRLNFTNATSCLANGYYWRNDIGFCVDSGDATCANYATYCQAEEVGCQGYRPLDGGPEVSAKVTSANVCPSECSGYDSYLQLPNYFERVEQEVLNSNKDFIPQTAAVCRLEDVGCEQFTNLDEVSRGGEGIEYFSYLRQCISPNNPGIGSYFTWEGSDTTGYQLKRWELLASNLPDGRPCTNIAIGTETCQDTPQTSATCFEAGIAFDPATGKERDCRDFFTAEDDHFLIWQDSTVTASNECRPYRRTKTGTIFNADPTEGRSCSAAANGCQEYRGNQGNNVRNVVNTNFETGTIGNWQNTQGTNVGLTISNEAVYQGGHSLKVSVSNNTVDYPLENQIAPGRQYTLSFWAKKADFGSKNGVRNKYQEAFNTNPLIKLAGLFGSKVQAAVSDDFRAVLFNFEANGLTSDWALYTIGPVELDYVTSKVRLRLLVNNLGPTEGFYLDNVVLKEVISNFYLIENSWVTPNSCSGQQGCKQYLDRQNGVNYLKSFDYVCNSSAIGCEAYLDTQNSSYYQSKRDYNTGVCNASVGEILAGGNCAIRGVVMCNVGDGDSCNYTVTTVPNDEIIYLVNDPAKECSSDKQGCQKSGKPSLNRQVEDSTLEEYITGYSSVHLINNPDNYGASLCSESALFCTEFTGDFTGKQAYFDPVGSGGDSVNRTCYYDGGNWYKTGTDPREDCPGNQFLPVEGQYNYDGWVGVCPSNQSTCTEFRDPSTPLAASGDNPPSRCDANISPNLSGIVDNDVPVGNQFYQQININGVNHYVCKKTGANWGGDGCTVDANEIIYYSDSQWYCVLNSNNTGQNSVGCSVGGVEVCKVRPGQQSCNYSLTCNPYYYLKNTVEQGESCKDGKINPEGGCLLFSDTSSGNLNYSSKATQNELSDNSSAAPQSCTAGSPFGSDGYCDTNQYYSVVKDRQCSEWLQCGSAVQLPDGTYSCTDLIRCKSLDPKNPDKCLEPVVYDADIRQPVTVDASQVDEIRYLTGYSHAGIDWGLNKAIEGYYSPESMLQVGEKLKVDNGGFEEFRGDLSFEPSIGGWSDDSGRYGASDQCTYSLNTNKVHSGKYSLALTVRERVPVGDQTICVMRSNGGNQEGFYRINPDSYYSLSFYAMSSTGQQRGIAGLMWYDNSGRQLANINVRGVRCDGADNTSCRTASSFATSATDWQKVLMTFGPEGGAHSFNEIPENAALVKIILEAYENTQNNTLGTVLFDDVALEPTLQVSDSLLVSKDCRLYPREDSPSCSYQTNQVYTGWNGYCLEPDPYYQSNILQPNNWQNCLQWYPVDSLSGDTASVFNIADIGYQDRRPLYYCLQSSGLYSYDTTGTKRFNGYVQWNNSHLNPVPGLCYDAGNLREDHLAGQTYTVCTGDGSNPATQIVNSDTFAGYGVKSYEFDSFKLEKVESQDEWPDLTISADWFLGLEYNNFDPAPGYDDYTIKKTIENNQEVWDFYHDADGDGVDDGLDGCSSGGDYDGLNGGHIRFKLFFNQGTKILESWEFTGEDCGGEEDEFATYKVVFNLREACSYIAQVVDDEGNEKAWLNRFNNGWSFSSGNQSGVTKNISNGIIGSSPYGSFIQPTNFPPERWNNISVPLIVYQGSGYNGKSYAGFPVSTERTINLSDQNKNGRTCISGINIGNSCNTSTQCSDANNNIEGVCMGIGKFCYDSTNNLTNGRPCSTNTDCNEFEFASFNDCRGLGNSNEPQLNYNLDELDITPQNAMARLQNLFAKVYGVWKWSGDGYEVDDSFTSMDISGVQGNYTKPEIRNLEAVYANNSLEAPGGLVYLNFETNVNNNQLPIEEIYIEWGDEEAGVGPEKHIGPFAPGNHTFYHYYTCPSDGYRCTQCKKTGDQRVISNGECVYTGYPKVNIKDHWGWCAAGDSQDSCLESDLISNDGSITISPRQ